MAIMRTLTVLALILVVVGASLGYGTAALQASRQLQPWRRLPVPAEPAAGLAVDRTGAVFAVRDDGTRIVPRVATVHTPCTGLEQVDGCWMIRQPCVAVPGLPYLTNVPLGRTDCVQATTELPDGSSAHYIVLDHGGALWEWFGGFGWELIITGPRYARIGGLIGLSLAAALVGSLIVLRRRRAAPAPR